jgi:rare lipoprotein A
LITLSGCGRRQVQVTPPQPVSISATELEGIGSYYAEPYHGRRTANCEIFDTYQHLTAAHKTLPFNTLVRVTNTKNGREVDVRINDRGPFVKGRVIDLSVRAAREIDMVRAGLVPVKIQILKTAEAVRALTMYAVQVGAFENRRSAQDLKERLSKKYAGVTVETFSGEKTLYRIRIGRERDLEAANRLAAQLRKEDLDTFVVRVN